MNAGVSMAPCAVLSSPARAFVLLSVALTSNIGPNLGNDGAGRKQSIASPGDKFALAGLLLDCACADLCLGSLATLYASARPNCRSRHLGLSLPSAAKTTWC